MNGTSPFRRVYCDLPSEVAERLAVRARESRKTIKDYLAALINADDKKTSPTITNRSKVVK